MNHNQQTTSRADRHGSNNPMYGRHHSDESKQKMSQSAKERWERMKGGSKPEPLTMDAFLSENPKLNTFLDKIITETINKVLLWQRTTL